MMEVLSSETRVFRYVRGIFADTEHPTKTTEFIPILLGPDGTAGWSGKGAISATPARSPRPNFGLDAFERSGYGLRAALLPPRRSGPISE
jgi:hypothetical protein